MAGAPHGLWSPRERDQRRDCASMNKSSSYSLLKSAIKRAKVSSQRVAISLKYGACSLKQSTVAGSSSLRGLASPIHKRARREFNLSVLGTGISFGMCRELAESLHYGHGMGHRNWNLWTVHCREEVLAAHQPSLCYTAPDHGMDLNGSILQRKVAACLIVFLVSLSSRETQSTSIQHASWLASLRFHFCLAALQRACVPHRRCRPREFYQLQVRRSITS